MKMECCVGGCPLTLFCVSSEISTYSDGGSVNVRLYFLFSPLSQWMMDAISISTSLVERGFRTFGQSHSDEKTYSTLPFSSAHSFISCASRMV